MYAIKKDPYSNTIGSKYISSASKKTYSYEDTKSDTSFSEKSIEERRIEKQLQQPLVLKDFKHEFDKTETILEYVKGIDSESKAIFEEVKKDNKRYIDYDKIHTIVSTLIAPIATITTTPIIPINTITPITSKDNTSNDETSHNDLETLIQLNTKLLTTVNKLVLEVKHIKMELLETTEKLDYISSHVEHLYDKSFIYKKNASIESIEEKKEEIKIIEEKIIEEKTIEEKTIEEKKVEEKKVEEKTIEVEEIKEEIKEEVKEKEDIEQPETVDVPIEIKEEEKIDIVEEPKQFFKTSASKSVKRLKK